MNQFVIEDYLKNTEEVTDFLSQFDSVSVWQTPLWNATILKDQKKRWFLLRDENRIVASCLVIERLLFCRIQFGPLYIEKKYGEILLEQLISFYKSKFIGFIDIQTDLYCCDIFEDSFYTKMQLRVRAKNNSWATKTINLNQEINAIYSSFSTNHKRSIQKMEKLGLKIIKLNSDIDFNVFFDIYEEMHEKRDIHALVKDRNSFLAFCNQLKMSNELYLYGIVDVDHILLGGALFLNEGTHLIYQFGATKKEIKLPLLHGIFYKALIDAKKTGFTLFDFGGYAIGDNLNVQTANINKFKDGFGGEILEYPERIQVSINFVLSNLIRFLMFLRTKLR